MTDKQSVFLTKPRSQSETSGSSEGHQWNSGVTRRSFLKRTGGATLATMVAWHSTQNHAHALVAGTGNSICPGLLCGGYTPNDGTVYADKVPKPGVAVTYFTIGKCQCSGGKPKKFDAWQVAVPPPDQEIFFIEEQPGLEHTAGHGLPIHRKH